MGGPKSDGLCPSAWRLVFLAAVLSTLHAPNLVAQTTLTVNTTNDVDDGVCDVPHCSLREAINAANAAGGAVIAFNIPGTGPHSIRPTSNLPLLMGDVTLDGTTEPDFTGTPVIELDGTLAGGFAQGLAVAGSGNLIRGFVVNRFSDVGISIGSGAEATVVEGCYVGTDVTGTVALGNGNIGILIGQATNNIVGGTTAAARNLISGNPEGITVLDVTATGNAILGNYIGTDVSGTTGVPNGVGILLLAPGNTVGGSAAGAGNLISGNTGNGVSLGPPDATGNLIAGNYIGVDASGSVALGNDIGVWVDNVADNTIGGTTAAARNVISGNREGVTLWEAGATGNRVQGNYIGTNASGDLALPNEMGIPVYAPGNIIGGTEAGAGNLISGNETNGVNFYGEHATENTVQGNLIGTDATGTAALGNGESGVAIQNAASENTVGGTDAAARNVLSGNTFGILIGDLSVTGTRIQGNYIGTNATGDAAIPNTQTGILLWAENTVIGGSEDGAGNVISGNAFAGIDLGGGSTGTTIQGNYIGIDATGSTAVGNDLGIFVNFSPGNTIGGTEAGAGNVISGNAGRNIEINGPDAAGNTLRGNLIGTDATGTVGLESGRAILVFDAPDNTIGGTEAGAGNVISGNRPGISIEGPSATGNVILGNYLGTDVTGSVPLGNGGATIRFTNGASNNSVGGTEPGAGNIIANGSWVGVGIFPDAGTGNRILSNAIFDNAGMGIEINRDGVTPNDEGDADTGPNDFQNYPALTTSVASNGGAAVQATLNSTPSSTFTLDFFSNDVCDETGFGEGRYPLGTAALTTDATGLGSVTTTLSGVTGTVLTATATDANGSTSEFSQCATVTTLQVVPSPATRTVTQGQSAMFDISVTTQGGPFEETVALSCSGNPAGTSCTFDQDQITLTGGQASTTMTVTTVAPAGSAPLVPGSTPRGPSDLWVLGILLAAGLLALSTSDRLGSVGRPFVGRRLRKTVARAGLFGALLLIPVSCGEDGTKPPTGGTPPGSYEITVAATWETVEVTTTATMVVQ